jgi:putative nucleotidyltransferase with HDIG domain
MSLIKSISKRINDFPMLSAVASRLLTISGDDRVSLKDIVKIVEKDAYLSSRILRIANSAAFSRGKPIATIAEAIVRLGEKTIVGIAMESSSTIFKKTLVGYHSPAGELWDHSLHTAIAAREIVNLGCSTVQPDLAYTAGLLHDLGKPVISDFFTDNAGEMAVRCDKHQVEDFAKAERDLLGMDHAEAGYELALRWKLPKSLCMAIKYHHQPSQADPEFRGLVYAVHIADILAMMEGVGTGVDNLSYRMDQGYKQFIKIDKVALSKIVLLVRDEFVKTQQYIFGGDPK